MYFGSVRFFKNMILLAVIICIAIPTSFSIHYHNELQCAKEDIQRLTEEIEQQNNEPTNGEAPYYQSLYPDFYAPQNYGATESAEKTMYLTFDDGPSDRTDEILDLLAKKQVKATFFVIGNTDEAAKDRMRRIVAEGHTLGMHSYTHNYEKIYASVEAYLDDMYQIFSLIKDTTGQTPSVFRFPGGSINGYNAGIYKELVAEMIRRGFVPYDWNVSSQDASGNDMTPTQIINAVVNGAENTSRGFVLFHDSQYKNSTVKALGEIIEDLRKMGFQFQAVSPTTKPTLFAYRFQ